MLEIFINLAECYSKMGLEDEAEKAFEKSLQYYSSYESKSPMRIGSTVSRQTANRQSVIRKIAMTMKMRNEYEKAIMMLNKVL